MNYSIISPRSKSTLESRMLPLATAVQGGGGESLISPPSESGTSSHMRDMDTQSSLSSSSDNDLSASDNENEDHNAAASELLEKSLESAGVFAVPSALLQQVNGVTATKEENGDNEKKLSQSNGNSTSSLAAVEQIIANQEVKVEAAAAASAPVATEANTISVATGGEASIGVSVMESHGTQTSLPRSRPKQHRTPRGLHNAKQQHHYHAAPTAAAAATAAAPVVPAGAASKAANKSRPQAPPFQVKRRPRVRMPTRRYRSLDYIPSDVEDVASLVSSRAESPRDDNSERGSGLLAIERAAEAESLGFDSEAFLSISSMIRRQLMPDNISLSSMSTCSEMSKSDPNLNYDSGSNAYDSEYDNYRPGMASDEDYFVPDPISDVDLDMFDDIDVENVTVSDKYSVDMPLSFLQHKRITQV